MDSASFPNDHIQLKVKAPDHEEVNFKIKTTSSLKKLMEKYCQRLGITNVDSVNFIFDGYRIFKNETPQNLGMKDGDEIEVNVMQVGG